MQKIILPLLMVWLWPQALEAHSFGILYNLPVPFWMYLYGAAAAIVVSFLVIGYFSNRKIAVLSYPSIDLSRFKAVTLFRHPRLLGVLRAAGISLLFLTILSGLFGNNSYSGFSMTFFWIIFLLGFTYATALLGNFYAFVNPWKSLAEWLTNNNAPGLIRYPKSLGYYPALFFYFILIWFELVGHASSNTLSVMLIVYTAINCAGAIVVGTKDWFQYCEVFGVFFGLIGKMAPIEYRSGKIFFRPPFVGLLKEAAEHVSLLLFTLFMLSGTAFDGFKETLPWVRFYWEYLNPVFKPFFGSHSFASAQTLALGLSPFLFLIIYFLLIAMARMIARNATPLKDLLLQFAFSLIPIALVYNIAHYYTLVLTEGPNIIGLISDPFGFGWNLFGTAPYYNNFVPSANWVWHSQVLFILLGHVAGVYLSHVIALKNFSASANRIFFSQLPMLLLMVIYTVAGLWILS